LFFSVGIKSHSIIIGDIFLVGGRLLPFLLRVPLLFVRIREARVARRVDDCGGSYSFRTGLCGGSYGGLGRINMRRGHVEDGVDLVLEDRDIRRLRRMEGSWGDRRLDIEMELGRFSHGGRQFRVREGDIERSM
jgi:hypothetical protein